MPLLRFFLFQEKPTMSNAHQHEATPVEPLLMSQRRTRQSLGDASETAFWEWVKRGLIPVVYCGRKALVPYPAVKELARRIEAGELAPARSAFSDHGAAIAKSVASRRRKAQMRATSTPAQVADKHRDAPAGEPPDPPPGLLGRRP
jgi:hypothetical protein